MIFVNVRFSRSSSCSCPSFGDYYIQGVCSGSDVYGNETYMYALFLHSRFTMLKRFRTRKQAYIYLSTLTGLSLWDVRYHNSSIIINDRYYLGVCHCNDLYRLNKYNNIVEFRPAYDERLSIWYDTLSECIQFSKEFVSSKIPEQLSFYDLGGS